ncbi:MAG: ABC transporter ATP-binding protein [Clostridiales Family XIII bacterium]|jgi:iron complex transport system ATP-binding protein|nr:ABC transporter ATP-binding protein [Clostridiales Family XIII bacterium]
MEIRGLSFSYGKESVLRDIDFAVPQGKVTTILGSNGSGKTTLFHLMTRNLAPQGGEILLGGKPIGAIPLKEYARKVAIVGQSNTVSADISVERLVGYGRTPFMSFFGGHTEEDRRCIEWAMDVTGVDAYRGQSVMKLSGGQRQRAFIAMALAQNTKLLLLDEPTTWLDIRYQVEILRLIRRLNSEYGITIVMVLHDINQAIRYSDVIVGLKGGRIAFQGSPEKALTPERIESIYGIRLEIIKTEETQYVLQA